MHFKNKLRKTAAVVLSAAMLGLFGTAQHYSAILPDSFRADSASDLEIAQYPELSCSSAVTDTVQASAVNGDESRVTLSLLGAVPVKNVSVQEAEAPVFVVGGKPFGIKLLMEGVMVTGLSEVETESGEKICPAEKSGIRVGDVIRTANGEELTSNSSLQRVISSGGGKSITLSVVRDGSEFTAELTPVCSKTSGKWRGGMWVRDSIAGIGTMTFINKETGGFAGLGHPICDGDTGELVPLHSGEAVPVEITSTAKGRRGIPGELRGDFTADSSYGLLNCNNKCGIFGILTADAVNELCCGCEEFPLAYRQEVKTGKAEIYSTIDGSTPKKYSAEIESIDYTGSDSTKNMVIRITDKELIEKTGGIIQGMSGSPIIQNGKLVGAVTHVFVSDPTTGYAIFAENMAETLEN